MGETAKSKGFEITVIGEYYTLSETVGKKKLLPYTLKVNLPSMDSALSVIRNKLLPKLLKAKYPGYIAYRTHQIIDVKNLDSPGHVPGLTPREMNHEQLIEYVASKELPVNIEAFPELDNLRKAVDLAETRPDEFKIFQEESLKDVKLEKELKERNPEYKKGPEDDKTSGAGGAGSAGNNSSGPGAADL